MSDIDDPNTNGRSGSKEYLVFSLVLGMVDRWLGSPIMAYMAYRIAPEGFSLATAQYRFSWSNNSADTDTVTHLDMRTFGLGGWVALTLLGVRVRGCPALLRAIAFLNMDSIGLGFAACTRAIAAEKASSRDFGSCMVFLLLQNEAKGNVAK
jgi:hypothetical protein